MFVGFVGDAAADVLPLQVPAPCGVTLRVLCARGCPADDTGHGVGLVYAAGQSGDQPVVTAGPGVVRRTGWDKSFLKSLGRVVVVEHRTPTGVRYQTVYGHLSRIAVRSGQRLRGNETIGFIGGSSAARANRVGRHLLLAVYVLEGATGGRGHYTRLSQIGGYDLRIGARLVGCKKPPAKKDGLKAVDVAGDGFHLFRMAGVTADAWRVFHLAGRGWTADRSWREGRMALRFARAEPPATYFVLGKDSGDSLAALLSKAEKRAPLSSGPLVLLVAPGAKDHGARLLGHPELKTVVLLDALDGRGPDYFSWVAQAPSRRLIVVAAKAYSRAEEQVARVKQAVQLRGLINPAQLKPSAERAKVLYLRLPVKTFEQMVRREEALAWALSLAEAIGR